MLNSATRSGLDPSGTERKSGRAAGRLECMRFGPKYDESVAKNISRHLVKFWETIGGHAQGRTTWGPVGHETGSGWVGSRKNGKKMDTAPRAEKKSTP
jgi:hypothetical protein